MTIGINDKLAQFLKEGQNWEKKPTNIQGVFLLKLPASKQSPSSIAIEINPINASTGLGIKKIGIIIRDGSELEQFSQLLSNPKVVELASFIRKNQHVTRGSKTTKIPMQLLQPPLRNTSRSETPYNKCTYT
jgi:hypothetical protein